MGASYQKARAARTDSGFGSETSDEPAQPAQMEPDSGSPRSDRSDPLNLSIVNLDTGEVEDLGREEFGRFTTWEQICSSPSFAPWGSWWKLRRRRMESLFEAAATGDAVRVRALCEPPSASLSEAPALLEDQPCEMSLDTMNGDVGQIHPDTRGLYGRTALHVAAHSGHVGCVSSLLELGASVDAQTDAGFTALHLCCQRGHLSVLQALLLAAADLTTQADQGETPLHLAAAHGQAHVVAFLLKNPRSEGPENSPGVSLQSIRNHFGQRPSEVARDAATFRCFEGSESGLEGGECVEGEGCCDTYDTHDTYAGRTMLQLRPRLGELRLGQLNSTSELEEEGELVEQYLPEDWLESDTEEPQEQPAHADADDAAPAVLLRNSRCDAVHRLLAASEVEEFPSAPPPRTRSARPQSFLRLQEKEPSEAVGPDSFSLLSLLGKGSFGEVFKVADRQTGQVFAMKVLRKRKILSRNLMRYVLTERNLLSYIRHPFIVRLYHAFQTPSCLVLVLQYCPGGNLSMLLQREGALPEAVAQLYVSEVLLALEHLHERRVVYRDLKPENVVLDEEAHAVLTDFGLSKEGVDKFGGTKSFCGSVAYLAPEILTRSGHGRNVDLYGLGVLLFEMMEGQPPYYSRDRDTLFRNIVTAPLQAPSCCSSRCADLIKSLMQRDPAKRIGKRQTSEVRHHPFFIGIDFQQVLKREVPVPPLHRPSSFAARAEEKVASPFEGRFGRKVFRSWSSSQDIRGWEFSFVDTECDLPCRAISKVEDEEPGKNRRKTFRRASTLGDLRRAASTTFRTLLS